MAVQTDPDPRLETAAKTINSLKTIQAKAHKRADELNGQVRFLNAQLAEKQRIDK
jgi:hypothetical protein